MDKIDISDFIGQPINRGHFSFEFIAASKEMGIQTVRDVIAIPPKELMSRKGFNYDWLGELIVVLRNNNLLNLLQGLPGNIPG
jgi:hypothetical protein